LGEFIARLPDFWRRYCNIALEKSYSPPSLELFFKYLYINQYVEINGSICIQATSHFLLMILKILTFNKIKAIYIQWIATASKIKAFNISYCFILKNNFIIDNTFANFGF
jgi:hypothetical protein